MPRNKRQPLSNREKELKIAKSRETRLWVTQVAAPLTLVAAVIAFNPRVRESVNRLRNTIKENKKENKHE